MIPVVLRINENQIGVEFTVRALFELSCLLETNEVNKTLIPQQDDYLTVMAALTHAGMTGYNHKYNQPTSVPYSEVLSWIDQGYLNDEHYSQIITAFEVSKSLPNEPDEQTTEEGTDDVPALTWKTVFTQSTQAGISLPQLYNMFWWEFVLSYEGYKERELDEWRRVRWASYITYTSNWADPKRKPAPMAKFLPLKGDEHPGNDFNKVKREWDELKRANLEALRLAREQEKEKNKEHGKDNGTD